MKLTDIELRRCLCSRTPGMSLHDREISEPEDAPGAFQAAWNAHDMTALGGLFDDDATFVNRFGHYVQGIDEIVALHTPIHETIYRDSTLKNELIDAVPLADGVVVIHFYESSGEARSRSPGPRPHRGCRHAGSRKAVLTRRKAVLGTWSSGLKTAFNAHKPANGR